MRDANRTGKRYERRTVTVLRAAGFTANRDASKLEHDGRAVGVDVRANRGEVHLAIQCRDRRYVNIWDAVAVAEHGAGADEFAIAWVRRVTEPWPAKADDLVCMSEETFLALLARLPVEDL